MAIEERDGTSQPLVGRALVIGLAVAVVATGLGFAVQDKPDNTVAVVSAIIGVVAMLIAGYAVAHRPKETIRLLIAAATALLAGFATNPAWDSIRLMQWVMAGTAAASAIIVLLPQTLQRVAFSVLVLYHFAGICSAITSPPPQPWLTGQLWTRVFRPHLEFAYMNNAYQFYSPQPGPAQILWFCITGTDGVSRWFRMPIKGEMLDPLAIEYFRRLSLTERANQNSGARPTDDMRLARLALEADFPFHPDMLRELQFRAPNEMGRHILHGYAEHVAKVLGTGRKDTDGQPVPVHDIKIYLTQHEMLTQIDFQQRKDPYAPETYRPYFVGQFDAEGNVLMNDFDRSMLYWVVPIIRSPSGVLMNTVIKHAGSDPFDPALAWRQE
jgi:hypothetical protein